MDTGERTARAVASAEAGHYEEAHMVQWKRTMKYAGVSVSAMAIGLLAAEGTAGATGAAAHPHWVQGRVTAVSSGSFTIATGHGAKSASETIDTTSATTYRESGTPVAPSGVSTGQDVVVGLDPSDSTPTAVNVTILLNRVSGKVTDVTSTSITLSGPRDFSREITVSSSTKYYEGKTAATGVTDGEFVTAFGSRAATTPGSFNALFVDIEPTSPVPPKGPVVHPGPVPAPWKPVTPGTSTPPHSLPVPATTPHPSPAPSGRPSAPAGTPHPVSAPSHPEPSGAPAAGGGGGQFSGGGNSGHGFGGGPGAGGR